MTKTAHHSELPHRVRFFRERAELTLEILAAKIGTTPSALSKIERGDSPLSLPWMERIARELGIAAADLLNEEHGGLSDKERRIVDTYREVPAPLRGTIEAVADSQQGYRRTGDGEVVEHRRSA